MRVGVFGGSPPGVQYPFSTVLLTLSDSLLGFDAFIFYSDLSEAVLSDSWLSLALSLSLDGFPVLWWVDEHPRWRSSAESLLVDAGVFVVESSATLSSSFDSFIAAFHLDFISELSVFYGMRLTSSVADEALALEFLSTLPDAEAWIKSMILQLVKEQF